MIHLILYSMMCFAQVPTSEKVLDELPNRVESVPKKTSTASEVKIEKAATISVGRKPATKVSVKIQENSNLPSYAHRKGAVEFNSPVIYNKTTDFRTNPRIKPGDTLKAIINHSIKAYPDSQAPVTARVIEGEFKGSLLLGTASMDKTTKRIDINFTSIRSTSEATSFDITGLTQSEDGQLGVEGIYESKYWEYFWAETLANSVAAAADATTQKTQTQFGGFLPTPGIDSSVRQGVAVGMARTAERLGERARSQPEITTATGPILINVIITK